MPTAFFIARGRKTLPLIVCVLSFVGIVAIFVLFNLNRRPVLGTCEDYSCIERTPALAPLRNFIPANVKQIRYYGLLRVGYYEAVFPCSNEEFLQWAQDQGWAIEDAKKNHGKAALMVYDTDGLPRTLEISDGYWLIMGVRRSDGTIFADAKTLAFDRRKSIAYLQVWTNELTRGAQIDQSPVTVK